MTFPKETREALKKAQLHQEAGNRQLFLKESESAQLIIGELMSTLDLEAGGELAANLQGLYSYCIKIIIEATLEDSDKLAEVITHIGRITVAWKTATAELAADGALPPPRTSSNSVA